MKEKPHQAKESQVLLEKVVKASWMSEIFIAIISFLGTLLGTFGGILTSAKLTNYRLLELEKRVEKHNSFITRIPVIEEQIKVSNHRITDLEGKVR